MSLKTAHHEAAAFRRSGAGEVETIIVDGGDVVPPEQELQADMKIVIECSSGDIVEQARLISQPSGQSQWANPSPD